MKTFGVLPLWHCWSSQREKKSSFFSARLDQLPSSVAAVPREGNQMMFTGSGHRLLRSLMDQVSFAAWVMGAANAFKTEEAA